MYIYIYTYTHTYTLIYTYTHTYTHIYIHTYIYVYQDFGAFIDVGAERDGIVHMSGLCSTMCSSKVYSRKSVY